MVVYSITGHRPDKFLRYSDESTIKMVSFCKTILEKYKPDEIVNGMALGFDQYMVQAAIELNIPFMAAVPFIGQESNWTGKSKAIYDIMLSAAKEVVVVSDGGFAPWKFHTRNEYLVNNSDKVLTCFNGDKAGGTAACLKYAQKQEKEIINVWNDYLEFMKNE